MDKTQNNKLMVKTLSYEFNELSKSLNKKKEIIFY